MDLRRGLTLGQVSIRTLLKTNSSLPLECTLGPTSHLPLSAGANLRLILVTCYFRYLKIPSDKQLTELGILRFLRNLVTISSLRDVRNA